MTQHLDDWTFEATRTCRACGGTGRTPDEPHDPSRPYAQGPRPVECQTCNVPGDKYRTPGRERRRFTIEDLRPLLLP